jgi:hypothetical protein
LNAASFEVFDLLKEGDIVSILDIETGFPVEFVYNKSMYDQFYFTATNSVGLSPDAPLNSMSYSEMFKHIRVKGYAAMNKMALFTAIKDNNYTIG